MTLAEVNAIDRDAFVAALGAIFEHSPWVAERVFGERPFASVGALHAAMLAVVDRAIDGEKQRLLRAHPELSGKAAIRGELTADSHREQSGAGLHECSPAEFARLGELNAGYTSKFGFPFIIAVKGLGRQDILREFARRLRNDHATERAENLAQVGRIARFRLEALIEA
jgi:2-oxo-4-hydroxy-4-carboxy-5-ureidoimidazoline decarboxylase